MAESLLARTNLNLLWTICLTSYVYLPLNSRGIFVLRQVALVALIKRGVCVCMYKYIHVCFGQVCLLLYLRSQLCIWAYVLIPAAYVF